MALRKKRQPGGEEAGLKLLERCPLCEAPYEPLEIKVLEEKERAHLLHVTCRSCKHAVAALVEHSAQGITSLGIVTDVDPEDVQNLRELSPVTWDDCIAWHEFLKSDQWCKEIFHS